MSSTRSPDYYEANNNLSAQMPSQLSRRTSRSSGSHSGYRVEKPKSNHNSPMVLQRRRTTCTAEPKRYATLDDHFNKMFGITGEEETQPAMREPVRPVSWHPSTYSQATYQPQLSVQTTGQDWSRHSTYATSDYYSLSAQSEMCPTQFQNCPTYPTSHDSHRGSQDSTQSWHSQQYAISAFSTPSIEPMPWYLNEWARKNQMEASNKQGESTDFLPIQHPASYCTEKKDMEDSGKELVALGLYDSPEPELSWDSSALTEGTGKGLKLEETWQPPEESEDEDDEDDASSDEGSIAELPPAQQPAMQLPIHNVKPQVRGNMEGQSFFFDEDDNKEWWYQQLRQPTVPVQNTGLGYGWL